MVDLLAISTLALGGCSQATTDGLGPDPAMKAVVTPPASVSAAPAASSAYIPPVEVPVEIEGDVAVVKPTRVR